jgi:hypothetical protein
VNPVNARTHLLFWAIFLLSSSLALSGCQTACRSEAQTYCRQCDGRLDGWSKLNCSCLNNGTISRSDADSADLEGAFETDDDAARWCARLLTDLDSTADDTDAACQAALDWMNAWPEEACPEPEPDDDDSVDDDDAIDDDDSGR